MKILLTSLLVFTIIGVGSAFADIQINPVTGSGSPGCEITKCYTPSTATVSLGETVKFYNTDSAAHTFTSGNPDKGPSGVFDSSLVISGSTYAWTPKSEGVYPYYCMVHPWMLGTLIVGDGVVLPPAMEDPPVTNPVELQQLKDENAELKSENLNLKLENRDLKTEVTRQDTLIESLQKKISDLNIIIQEQIKVIYDWVIAK